MNPNFPSNWDKINSTDTAVHAAEMRRRAGVVRKPTPRLFALIRSANGGTWIHRGERDTCRECDHSYSAKDMFSLSLCNNCNAKRGKKCDHTSGAEKSSSNQTTSSSAEIGSGALDTPSSKSPSSPLASEIRVGDWVRCLPCKKWASGYIVIAQHFVGTIKVVSDIDLTSELRVHFEGENLSYPLRAVEKIEETPESRGWLRANDPTGCDSYARENNILARSTEGWRAYRLRPSPVYLCTNGVFGSGVPQYFQSWLEIDELLFETKPREDEDGN